jgi:lipopolysaccharide export system protein LptA
MLSVGFALNAGSSTVTIAGTATQSIAGYTTTGLTSMTKTAGTATLQGNVSGGALTMNGNGGTFNMGTSLTHTFSGTFTRTNGTFNAGTNNSVTFGGTLSGTTGTFTASSGTMIFNRAGDQTPMPVATYSNLILGGSGIKTFATTPTINGILSIEDTATVVVTTGVVTYGASATLQYNTDTSRTVTSEEWITPFTSTGGIIIDNIGTITLNEAKVLDTGVPLTINSGATLNTSGTNYQLTFGGNFVNSGGTFTANASPIVINSTATQSIAGYTTTGLTTMSKTAGTATFTSAVSGGALTINGSGGTLSLGTSLTHTFSGDVTLTAGTLNGGSSTLNLTNTSATVWNGTGSLFTPSTSTVNFSGSNQTLAASATTFNNLTFSGGGTKTFTSATVINGNFDSQGGGGGTTYATLNPLDKSSYAILSNGNLSATFTRDADDMARSTIGKTSGKWYWEQTYVQDDPGWGYYHIGSLSGSTEAVEGYNAGESGDGISVNVDGSVYINNSIDYGLSGPVAIGDVVGIGMDLDNGLSYYYVNNVLYQTIGSLGASWQIPGHTYHAAADTYHGLGTTTMNFGGNGLRQWSFILLCKQCTLSNNRNSRTFLADTWTPLLWCR